MGRGTIILLGWEPGTVDSLLLFSPVVEKRSIEMGCNRHGPGQCYFVKRKTGPSGLAPSTPKTPVSLLFWLQREEGALVSDPALLPPAAGPASGVPSPLLASLPLPTRPLQPPLDFKHLLAFHFNGAAPLTLFPNFSTMDPVQKAVISHTFGVPSPLKKKLFISCNICHLRFNSANQAEAHYKGHKHARKLKAVEAAKSKQRPQTLAQDGTLVSPTPTPASGAPEEPWSKAVPAAPPPGPELQAPLSPEPTPREPAHSDLLDAASSSSSCPPCSPEPGREAPGPEPAAAAVGSGVSGEGGSEKGRLYCPTCKVTVNSASQLQAHNTGQHAPPPPQVESQGDAPTSCGQARASGHFARGLGDRPDWVGL
uniref:C2H2-type domain-containing protein n=1 Tax=Sus scrofa TaxID=9823 RepID=A0A8D0Y2F7_PIG